MDNLGEFKRIKKAYQEKHNFEMSKNG